MVAVPAHGTRYVKHDFGTEQQYRCNLIANDLGGMEVAGIERDDFIVLRTVTDVEIIAAHGKGLKTYTEHL